MAPSPYRTYIAILFVLAAVSTSVCQEIPLASFTGEIREITRNKLAVETAGDNVIEFICTGKTRYFDGTRRIDRSALKPGIRVTVESRRGLDGSVEAVNVRLERLKTR